MAEIKFSMRTEALNVLVEFAKALIDTKAQMVHLRNAHCVVHGHDLVVSLVNPHSAARVTVPIIEKIEDGIGFDIRVPKKVDAKVYPTVSFTVDTSSDTCEFTAGGLSEIVQLEHGVFPNIDKYWDERDGVRKIGLNPALLLNAMKAFDKKKPVVLSMTNAKEPLYITQGDSKKCFVLPVVMGKET